MYIELVPNRNSPPAVLLRESWREGNVTRKRTLANLSHLPAAQVELIRKVLADEKLVSPNQVFQIEESTPHGHVEAIVTMIRKLGLESLIASKPSRQRDLVVAMIVERIIFPCSKLATTRVWKTTTLAKDFKVEDAKVGELYDALDWLLERQNPIEKKLARRHLAEGSRVLYDVSSSYYEGRMCALAQFGHDRDGKKGLPIIVYGMMSDSDGRPVAVSVYEGNTSDSHTVPDQVEKLREKFRLNRVILVGDRGMLTTVQIDKLRDYPQLGWISALRTEAIRSLANSGAIQMSLFDEQNLAEISSDDFPGKRLMVCFNGPLAEERGRKRDELLAETDKLLEKISKEVSRRTKKPLTEAQIGLKVGKIRGKFKMGKHYILEIVEGKFQWQRNEESIQKEKALDGIYVVRTSETSDELSADDTVRSYKELSHVERAFRTLKGMDIRVRPIRHWNSDHVKAHIFLCMLTYYVEWHLRKAWAPLLFDDEEVDEDRPHRDPVDPARCSQSAKRKKRTLLTEDGLPVHSFETLIDALSTRTRNLCRAKIADTTFEQITLPNPLQARAMELLKVHPVSGN